MPKTPEFFKNKTILITGAASGIGKETAHIFTREGANVVCADINESGAAAVAEEVKAKGVRSGAIAVDIASRDSVNDMTQKSIADFGPIHFLFNSAGGAVARSPFLEIDDDLWHKTYDINVHGTFYAMQAMLPHMIENGGGVIVNMASMAHLRGGPGTSVHYASSKGAVATMSLGVAREFVDQNIRCIPLCPAGVDTPFQNVSSPEQRAKSMGAIPMKRFGRPEEVGEVVLFVCSDACEFMTADPIYINGGGGFR
jgi:3-oxoacyl-[acyl-carrier protein] reductase